MYVKTLKAKRKREDYKNVNSYLDAVYRANKDYIDEHMVNNTASSNKTLFKKQVKEYMNMKKPILDENGNIIGHRKYKINEAIDKVKRSRLLTTKAEQDIRSKTFQEAVKGENYKKLKKALELKNREQYDEGEWEFLGYGTLNNHTNFQAYHYQRLGKHAYMIVLISPKGNKEIERKIVDSVEWRYGYEPYMH